VQATELFEEVIAAHGGRDRWQSVEVIEASFSSGGLAFAAHLQPFALKGLRVSLMPHSRHLALNGYCRSDWCGIWTPTHVQIIDGDDSVVAERCDPRTSFSRVSRQFRWDKFDLLYFAGYALWNYLSFPFILEAPGVRLATPGDTKVTSERRLTAEFDERVPTHSRLQTFHLDEAGLLFRHDYTADVIGRWATAANFCIASEQVDGLRFYTRRRVLPRFGEHRVSPVPTLVWIEIGDIRLVRTGGE
jgi:hypothetical protein